MSSPGGGSSHSDDDLQAEEGVNQSQEFRRLGESGEIRPEDLAAISVELERMPRNMSFLIGLLGNVHEARDVVHDVLCKLLEKPKCADEVSRWFYFRSACRKRAIVILRRRQHPAHQHALPTAYDGPDHYSDADPVQSSEREDTRKYVRQIIDGLSPTDKEVIVPFLDGSTNVEISKQLNIPRGTVGRRLHTVRGKLRNDLTDLGPDGCPPSPVD